MTIVKGRICIYIPIILDSAALYPGYLLTSIIAPNGLRLTALVAGLSRKALGGFIRMLAA